MSYQHRVFKNNVAMWYKLCIKRFPVLEFSMTQLPQDDYWLAQYELGKYLGLSLLSLPLVCCDTEVMRSWGHEVMISWVSGCLPFCYTHHLLTSTHMHIYVYILSADFTMYHHAYHLGWETAGHVPSINFSRHCSLFRSTGQYKGDVCRAEERETTSWSPSEHPPWSHHSHIFPSPTLCGHLAWSQLL